jgi:hypothetical protein
MKKNIGALFLGIFFTLLILTAVELFFRWNEKSHFVAKPQKDLLPYIHSKIKDFKTDPEIEALIIKDPTYQWKPEVTEAEGARYMAEGEDVSGRGPISCCIGWFPPVTNKQFESVVKTKDGRRIIFKAHYTFDNLGRRITPQRKNPAYNIIMFGDSFTLGEGVNDEESVPYRLALLRPNAQVFNMAVAGGSPNEFLYEVTHPTIRFDDVPKKKTIVLYDYMDNHLERLFCRSLCFTPAGSWILTKPYYKSVDGVPVYQGLFFKDRPVINFIYKKVTESALLRFFDVILPPQFSQRHFDFFADVILEAKKNVEKKFSNVEFFLVLYPGASAEFGLELRDAAKKKGIAVLDYSQVNVYQMAKNKATVNGDGHPSPVTHLIFAHLLNRDLPSPMAPTE